MNPSAKTWILLMMVPFFIGVIILFIVPLQGITNANPKLQGTYNGYKIQVQQNTIRALAFLNSKVISNTFQIFQNIQSTFISLYLSGQIYDYQNMNISQINIINAYQLTVSNDSIDVDLNHSMWYSPKTTNYTLMNQSQKKIFHSYIQVQPFIKSIFESDDDIYASLRSMTLFVNQLDQQFYFQYPSQNNSNFNETGKDILNNSFYIKSIQNTNYSGFRMTVFDKSSILYMCLTLYLNDSNNIIGVTCMGLDIHTVISDIVQVLGISDFQLSTNNYYFLRPSYSFQKKTTPQIIANFTSTNLSDIQIPNKTYFDLQNNQLPAQIFQVQDDFQLNIQRHQNTKTYYTIPIPVENYADDTQVILYLLVLNNFAKAVLSEKSQNKRIVIVMVVPSVLLLVTSIIVTSLILRGIFEKLDEALVLLGQYCNLIKRGDLQLQIPQYTKSQDLKQLFIQLQKLNQLSKYTDTEYFNVPKPQRIIRFLKCLQLFDDLNYDKTNLQQNISQCYVSIGDLQNAIKFLKLSISKSIQQTYGTQQQISKIYEQKITKKQKQDKLFRKKQKIIKRKYLRLCHLLFITLNSGNLQKSHQLTTCAQILRKISYPDILNFQYISCLFYIISCKIKLNDLDDIHSKMEILGQLVNGYSQVNKLQTNLQTPCDVMYSYWLSLIGSLKMKQKKFIQAFRFFVQSLSTNKFYPSQHTGIIPQLQLILQIYGMNKDQLKSLKFFQQYKQKSDREYIFLIDVSKPQMNTQQINIWKKKVRKMIEHIFNKQIKIKDRVSITQFCHDIKIICNLIQKGNRQKILKKQLMSSIKARDQNINSLPLPCLNKSIQRVKNLKNQKIFLIFLKDGLMLKGTDIYQQIKDVQNSKFIFFLQNPNLIRQKNDTFFTVDFNHEEDVDRILQEKCLRHADNIIYIL